MEIKIDHLKKLILRKKALHENIDELLVKEIFTLFHKLEHCELNEIRDFVADLSNELHKHEMLSIPLLLYMSFININKIMATEERHSFHQKITFIDDDTFMGYLEKCIEAFPNGEIRIFSENLKSIKIKNELEFYEKNKALLDLSISTPFVKNEIKQDMHQRTICLAISHHYSYKYNLQHEFYIQ